MSCVVLVVAVFDWEFSYRIILLCRQTCQVQKILTCTVCMDHLSAEFEF